MQIKNRLQFVQKELNRILETPNMNKNSRKEAVCLAQLSKLKSIHFRLWTINLQINERFNWTVLASVFINFLMIAIGCFWMLMRIRFNRLLTMWR